MKFLFDKEEIFRDKYFNIGQDWEVPIPGFFIISPNRKVESILDFTTQEYKEFMNLLILTRKGMFDVLNIKEVYLYENESSSHNFHFWVMPKYSWMDKINNKSLKSIIDHAKKNCEDKDILEVKKQVIMMKDYFKSLHI